MVMESPMDYKLYHEEYMKNHNGTSAIESMMVILPEPFSVFIATSIISIVCFGVEKKPSFISFVIEFIFIVIPTILCTTFLSGIVHLIIILFILSSFLLLFVNPYVKVQRMFSKQYVRQFLGSAVLGKRRAFITNFRATVNLMTAICILAVDFKIFPRRFAKTENYGYGLMDVGVGAFCIANAIISPEALGHQKHRTLLTSVGSSVKSSIPLIVLGFARLLTMQKVDYHQHMSEYGVHWNFFITLAVVKIVGALILNFVDVRHCLLLAIGLMATHECILQSGIQDWVLGNTPRDDLLSANREGLASSLGYIAVYFAGIALGQLLQSSATTTKANVFLQMKLIVLAMFLWICTFLSEYVFGISRRLANTGYCVWTMAYCVTLLIAFLLVELMICATNSNMKFYHKKANQKNVLSQVPIILDAISYNGLFFFLIANLGTGIVNISMKTLYVEKFQSFLIINCYMLIICSITVVLHVKEIKLKVW